MGVGYVSQIQRGEKTLHAVSPDVQLEGGDILWIAGDTDGISLMRNKKGLRSYGAQVRWKHKNKHTVNNSRPVYRLVHTNKIFIATLYKTILNVM